jgi:hypothetical protein
MTSLLSLTLTLVFISGCSATWNGVKEDTSHSVDWTKEKVNHGANYVKEKTE